MPIPLSPHLLPSIEAFPRKEYPIKALQFGTGNFLRGFADWMIQKGNEALELEIGVCVVQSFSNDTKLQRQQGLFTVMQRGMVNGKFRSLTERIDIVQKIIHATNEFDLFLKEAENPDLQIILSNTTESGIVFEANDVVFQQPAATFPGKLTQFLWARFAHYPKKKIIVLPTELVEKNGDVLRGCVLKYIDHWKLDAAFKNYVEEELAFCNTLVDRIVPGYPAEAESVWLDLGYRDELLTSCEPYHLWAVEAPTWVQDVFPLHRAGVNFVYTHDLAYYRLRKVRTLNGAHSLMAPVGFLAGIDTVQQAIEHPSIGKLINDCIREEILPTLSGDQEELRTYAHEVLQRFANPAIRHALLSITLNSFAKWRVRIVPTIIAYRQAHATVPERICFGMAAQFLLYRGLREGKEIDLKEDPATLAEMKKYWHEATFTQQGLNDLVGAILRQTNWWGEDLNLISDLRERVAHYLYIMVQVGILAAMEDLKQNLK